ncbi:MAG: DHH family phosphoesterase [Clostridia bacterium]|nr:DHH family phosphoesterase [Clostridia bacterium]
MSRKTFFSEKNRVPFASRLDFAISIVLACLNIALFAILSTFVSSVEPIFFALILIALYLIEIALLGIRRAGRATMYPTTDIYDLLNEEGSVVLKNNHSPFIVLNSHGIILWHNEATRSILPFPESVIGDSIESLFDSETKEAIFASAPVSIGKKIYDVEGFKISEAGDGLHAISLTDVTDLREAERRYNDERVAVAYIAIDNVEDVLQYIQEKFHDAVSVVDSKLKEWAASVNGVIKSYDNDKYIMFFDSMYLDACIADRFAILDTIRETRVGDGISVTVSIGVSRIAGSLAEREAAAREAIDMALQRGGDQAVYKTKDTTEYFGGRTKAAYKRSNVRSRTFTADLSARMARADNVIVMGHRFGDFDSFGASVGIARLGMLCGVKTNIAVDMHDKNLSPCIKLLQAHETYEQIFVDNAEGLDLVGPDTLIILVDHNSIGRAQFENIARKVDNIVVIDHHRTNDVLSPEIKLSYIEPSASSACELVSEMLENAISSQNLLKEVADMLLAGILLDTKQFTRNTGTRTFSAAQYLRGAGASPQDVYNLFKTSPSDLAKEARFHTQITIYRSNVAISCCEGDTDESYRIIASKAADKMLTLQGIEAAFTLVRIGNHIHISGRSNGTINVQLILEKLNGGGHFDVAGAQVISESIENVLDTLKASIDDYFEA